MISFIYSAVRFSTVFLFGSTGETITEKSGHLNLGVPGIMCLGALGGCVGETIYMRSVADLSQMNGFSVIIMGIIFSMLFAGIGGLIYGFMTITLRCNQNVSGLALTTFGTGVANYFLAKLKTENYSVVSDYFSRATENISAKDGFSQLFLSYGALVYIAIFLAIIVSIIFKKTKTGLSLTAVGENPAAADAAGINVIKYKYVACVLGAAIAGLGGLFYVMDNKIFNSRKRLISPIIKTQKFYGWKVTPMFTENSISIYTLFYTDNGFHVTEGVTLVYQDGFFEKFVPIGTEY